MKYLRPFNESHEYVSADIVKQQFKDEINWKLIQDIESIFTKYEDKGCAIYYSIRVGESPSTSKLIYWYSSANECGFVSMTEWAYNRYKNKGVLLYKIEYSGRTKNHANQQISKEIFFRLKRKYPDLHLKDENTFAVFFTEINTK